MGKVVFVLKPALLGAQCSISHEWFCAQFSPLCPACAFLWELAGNTTGLSCSRHKEGHMKVIFYVIRVRGWSYEGSFCLCCITRVHLFLHLFKQLSLASPFLPPQRDVSEINSFVVAPQALELDLAGSVLHCRRELDPKPVISVVNHAEVLHLSCRLCATLLSTSFCIF